MDVNEKIIALLEEIAFNTSSHLIERPEYLRRIYAAGSVRQGALEARTEKQKEIQKGKALNPEKHNDGRSFR